MTMTINDWVDRLEEKDEQIKLLKEALEKISVEHVGVGFYIESTKGANIAKAALEELKGN